MDVIGRIAQEHHDSPAGRWHFASLTPHALLHGSVFQIWYVKGRATCTREKILPSGDVVLLLNLGPTQGLVDRADSDRVTLFDSAFVSGFQQRYLVTEALDETHLMGVRLSPLAAFRMLRMPMCELTDEVVEGADIQTALSDLCGRLSDLPDLVQRFATLERWLLKAAVDGWEPAPVVAHGVRSLALSCGTVEIRALSRELGISPRHLNLRFVQQVGVGPKVFARVMRFQAALAALPKAASLARVAVDCGYYDQSHFNREFRALAGAPPRDYLRHASPDGTTILLDEAQA